MSGDAVPDRRNLRAAHEDRDQVVERLRVAAGDGRLTAEELDERLETALTARTYGELEPVLLDLPVVDGGHGTPVADDLVRLGARSSSIERVGPWVVPRRLEVEARSGSAVIDFTRAVITRSTLDLDVALRGSSLKLIAPAGVEVDVGEITMVSSNVSHQGIRESGVPVRLLVKVSGEMRSSALTVRGPRRTFWQWLLRRRPPMPGRAARGTDRV